MIVNGYAYPSISDETLQWWLERLTWVSTFSYGLKGDGSLINLDDERIIEQADGKGVRSMMVLAPMNEEGMFSEEEAVKIFNDRQAQKNLIENICRNIRGKGMGGIDFDFEYISGQYADDYARLVAETRKCLSPWGLLTTVALAPKTSDNQAGEIYEGHDYARMGQAADYCLLMTYEWGYAYGPPMAVSPMKNVRQVIEYAITRIPADKILLGMNNYGYDWALPWQEGQRAQTLTLQQAADLAERYGAQIIFDQEARAPYFEYTDEKGNDHIVWFENQQSWRERIALVEEYGLAGIGIWNIMEIFPGKVPGVI